MYVYIAKEGKVMDKIGGYNVYQDKYYNNRTQGKKEKDRIAASRFREMEEDTQVQLSDKAKKLLQELKKTYGNMDFIIADYETEEEAQAYLSRGTKEYSVLIDPALLEEMAADEDTKAKYIGIIDGATAKLSEMKDSLTDEEKQNVTHLGISIADDGTVKYFATLEKMRDDQRERLEEKAEDDEKDPKNAERRRGRDRIPPHYEKKTTVMADTVEDLLEQIRNVDWSSVKAQEEAGPGSRFDFSV